MDAPQSGRTEFFLPKEPGARNDTFHQLPLLPLNLKEKAESATGVQMADQPPGLGKTQCCKIPRLLFGEFSCTNCEMKQFSAPEDR